MLEGTHASLEKALRIETGEGRSICHKYIKIAVLINLTSYHTSSVPRTCSVQCPQFENGRSSMETIHTHFTEGPR